MRIQAPLRFLLRRYLRRNAVQMVILLATSWVFVNWIFWEIHALTAEGFLYTPVPTLAALALVLAFWPVRFGRGGGPYRRLPDGTVLPLYYSLRYFEANRSVHARLEDRTFDIGGNLFEAHHLGSLELEEDILDGYPGTADLVFSGSAVKHQALFGWPGVPRETVVAIRGELLRRVSELSEEA